MVSCAGVRVDAKALADHALPFLDRLAHERLDPPLAVQLTLAIGHDDLRSTKRRMQGFTEHTQRSLHIIGMRLFDPLDTNTLHGSNNGIVTLTMLVGSAR